MSTIVATTLDNSEFIWVKISYTPLPRCMLQSNDLEVNSSVVKSEVSMNFPTEYLWKISLSDLEIFCEQ